jgi:oligoribonuclease (3'-5' exoribonuclease)
MCHSAVSNGWAEADNAKMTGLDVENDVIIEIFCIITNGNLDIVDEEGWGAVIHQSKERMDQMVSLTNLITLIEAGLTAD